MRLAITKRAEMSIKTENSKAVCDIHVWDSNPSAFDAERANRRKRYSWMQAVVSNYTWPGISDGPLWVLPCLAIGPPLSCSSDFFHCVVKTWYYLRRNVVVLCQLSGLCLSVTNKWITLFFVKMYYFKIKCSAQHHCKCGWAGLNWMLQEEQSFSKAAMLKYCRLNLFLIKKQIIIREFSLTSLRLSNELICTGVFHWFNLTRMGLNPNSHQC